MTKADIQRELDRLSEADEPEGPRTTVHRRHLETMLCAARLQEAIDGADRWYEQREDGLRSFDRQAAATVRRLVADGRVHPFLAWPSPSTQVVPHDGSMPDPDLAGQAPSGVHRGKPSKRFVLA